MEYIIKMNVKSHVRKGKLRFAEATYGALDALVEQALDKAMERVKKNRRHTVMPQDL